MHWMAISRKAALLTCLFLCGSVIAQNVTWIDVRTAGEFEKQHVDGALNIPYQQIESSLAELALETDSEIYLYCGSGRRAGVAMETLESLGYTRVVNVGGLDDALSKAGKSNGN